MYKYILQIIKYKPCSLNQIRELPKMDCLQKIYLSSSAYYKMSLFGVVLVFVVCLGIFQWNGESFLL